MANRMASKVGAKDIITLLGLSPLPGEGGYYVETHRSDGCIPNDVLSSQYAGDRSYATAIYYLLTPDTFSAIHRLPSDEVYHFYLGDPVEMLLLYQDGSGKTIVLGSDLEGGIRPQVVIPRGLWQGSHLCLGGEWALLGTTVSPGFEFADYEEGQRDFLVGHYPEFEHLIRALTRK